MCDYHIVVAGYKGGIRMNNKSSFGFNFHNYWKDKDFYFGFNLVLVKATCDNDWVCYFALHLGLIGFSIGYY